MLDTYGLHFSLIKCENVKIKVKFPTKIEFDIFLWVEFIKQRFISKSNKKHVRHRYTGAFLMDQTVKSLPAMQETQV